MWKVHGTLETILKTSKFIYCTYVPMSRLYSLNKSFNLKHFSQCDANATNFYYWTTFYFIIQQSLAMADQTHCSNSNYQISYLDLYNCYKLFRNDYIPIQNIPMGWFSIYHNKSKLYSSETKTFSSWVTHMYFTEECGFRAGWLVQSDHQYTHIHKYYSATMRVNVWHDSVKQNHFKLDCFKIVINRTIMAVENPWTWFSFSL